LQRLGFMGFFQLRCSPPRPPCQSQRSSTYTQRSAPPQGATRHSTCIHCRFTVDCREPLASAISQRSHTCCTPQPPGAGAIRAHAYAGRAKRRTSALRAAPQPPLVRLRRPPPRTKDGKATDRHAMYGTYPVRTVLQHMQQMTARARSHIGARLRNLKTASSSSLKSRRGAAEAPRHSSSSPSLRRPRAEARRSHPTAPPGDSQGTRQSVAVGVQPSMARWPISRQH
jgi:hypothetical protein